VIYGGLASISHFGQKILSNLAAYAVKNYATPNHKGPIFIQRPHSPIAPLISVKNSTHTDSKSVPLPLNKTRRCWMIHKQLSKAALGEILATRDEVK